MKNIKKPLEILLHEVDSYYFKAKLSNLLKLINFYNWTVYKTITALKYRILYTLAF